VIEYSKWQHNSQQLEFTRRRITYYADGSFAVDFQRLSHEELLEYEASDEAIRQPFCLPGDPLYQPHLTAAYDWKHGVRPPAPGPAPCSHQWSHYVGFSNTFDYCTKCDFKRGAIRLIEPHHG
jgi:hypothetical protein